MSAVEKVVKRAIAKTLNERGELDSISICQSVKEETGHGSSRSKTNLSEMVGANEVKKNPRRLPKKMRTTYVLTDTGRRWLRE
ncbi:hypothetical protein D4R54_01645 [archaeon]|nr:MAG: hypothetical protein D4R54_01645 [archaeon]